MNSVNLLKAHYSVYNEAQVRACIYTPIFLPLFFFSSYLHCNRFQPALPCSPICCTVLQHEAQPNRLLRTSLLHWGQKTWFFIKWLCFIHFFWQMIVQEWRMETYMNRIQNLKFHCWTDTPLFIRRTTWLNAASSGRVHRRGKICGSSRFALRRQTDPDIWRHWLRFDVTVAWKNSIICRECNITTYLDVTGISWRVTSYVSKLKTQIQPTHIELRTTQGTCDA